MVDPVNVEDAGCARTYARTRDANPDRIQRQRARGDSLRKIADDLIT